MTPGSETLTYMGQKDQDGYYAEWCHFFVNFKANLKKGLNESKNMWCTSLSIRVIIW